MLPRRNTHRQLPYERYESVFFEDRDERFESVFLEDRDPFIRQ